MHRQRLILYFLRKCIKRFIKSLSTVYTHASCYCTVSFSLSVSDRQLLMIFLMWATLNSAHLLTAFKNIYPYTSSSQWAPAHNPPAPLLDHLSNPRALYLSSLSFLAPPSHPSPVLWESCCVKAVGGLTPCLLLLLKEKFTAD